MNDYGILSDRETTQRIWERVTGDAKAPMETVDIIKLKAESIGAYEYILRRICPRCRNTVLAILRDERRHNKTLRALYYMSEGRNYDAPAPCEAKQDIREALRSCYEGELRLSELLAQTARTASNAAEAEEFSGMSRDEARHASMLLKVMECCLA